MTTPDHFFRLVQPDIYLPKSLHRFFPLKMPMGPWKSKKVLTDSIAHFTFYFGPFSTSRGNYAFLRGKNYAATWAGVYVVGLSKKNDLGWSFRQMRAGSVDFFLKMITNRGVFCGQIPPALKKIINATRRRFFMRSFYLVMVLLENIVIMVIIDFQCFHGKSERNFG